MDSQPNPAPTGTPIEGYRWGTSAPVSISNGAGSIMAMGQLNLVISNATLLDENGELTEQCDKYISQVISNCFAAVAQSSSIMELQMGGPETGNKVASAANEQLKQYGVTITGMDIMNIRPVA